MSGVRPRATRSSVQKSRTVTTGFARPIVGRMLGPWTRAPIGHRRYSRSESGSRNVALAKSANAEGELDRKSTRLNSSHVRISYAVFCLKKKKKKRIMLRDSVEWTKYLKRLGGAHAM